MLDKSDIQIQNIQFHRNGSSGNPFYVILFRWKDDDVRTDRTMIGIVFDVTKIGINHSTAVMDADAIGRGDIDFGSNSWRGDHFHKILVDAIFDRQFQEYGCVECQNQEEAELETEYRKKISISLMEKR